MNFLIPFIAAKSDNDVLLFSRAKKSFNSNFSYIVDAALADLNQNSPR